MAFPSLGRGRLQEEEPRLIKRIQLSFPGREHKMTGSDRDLTKNMEKS